MLCPHYTESKMNIFYMKCSESYSPDVHKLQIKTVNEFFSLEKNIFLKFILLQSIQKKKNKRRK